MVTRIDRPPMLGEPWRGWDNDEIWLPRSEHRDESGALYGSVNGRNGLGFSGKPGRYYDDVPEWLPHGGYHLPGDKTGKIKAQDVSAKSGDPAPTVKEMTAYIREAAKARGIDPNIAVKVARSEGLAQGVWQSNVVKGGRRETSYGPFQLLVGGGLGDKFKKVTGKSPSDKGSWKEQVQFALDHAAENGWGSWYGAAKVGVNKWDGLNGAQPAGISAAETDVAATPEMAGGLGALMSGDWVEPMLAANQDRIGNRIESAFAPGAGPAMASDVLAQLASRGADPSSDRVGQAFITAEGSPSSPANADALARAVASMQADRRVGSAFDTAGRAPAVNSDPMAMARAVEARRGADPNARINQAFSVGGGMQPLAPGAPAAIDRIRAEYAARAAPRPTAQTAMVAPPVMTPKSDRLPAAGMAPADVDRTRSGIAQYGEARKTGAMTQYAPGTGPAAEWAARSKPAAAPTAAPAAKGLDANSLARAASVLDSALGPLGNNIMRVVDAVRSPSARANPERIVTTTTGRQVRPAPAARTAERISTGPGGKTAANTGLAAMAAVSAGRGTPGTTAFSASNPGFSAMSLPAGLVARSSGKYGWTEVYSPADDDVLGIHYGKVMAVDPTGSKYKAVTPAEAKSLASKGWSISNQASKGVAPGKSTGPGKSGPTGLAGFLSGLFGQQSKLGPAMAGISAASRHGPMGLAAGLFGPGAGMGGLGLGGGAQAGGLGGVGFGNGGGGMAGLGDNYGGL